MLKNKTYAKRAIPILVLSFFLFYFYAAINVEQMNVLQPYYMEVLGWDATAINEPVTLASLLAVPLTFVVGTLLLKFTARTVLGISTVLAGAAIVLLGVAGDNMALYWLGYLFARAFAVAMSMGSVMLCTNWFVKYRGTALGIVTIGSPACTATFTAILSKTSASPLGIPGSYTIFGILIVLVGICIFLMIKSKPSDCALYPDGSDHDVAITAENAHISVGKIFSEKRSWLLVIAFGILNWCIVCVSGFFVVNMINSSVDQTVYLQWLAIGSVLGIPASYILGVIDDKLGTPKASLILCALFLVALFGMIFIEGNNILLLFMVAIGTAGMSGGTANLHPSMTAYVFGNKNFQAANRWIAALQGLISAFAASFMAVMLDATGSCKLAYQIDIILVIIAAICIFIVGKQPDHDKRNHI